MSTSRQLQRAAQTNAIRQHSVAKTVALTLARVCVILLTAFIVLRFGRYTLARPTFISPDEGYVLLTLKHYFAGEHLYTQVFTQYGPFYFLIQKGIFRLLQLPVTYDAGRLVFYGYWVLASCLGGIFVYRMSKNVTLASAAALAVMWLERVMAVEPNHPEQMVVVLLMAACVVSVKPDRVSLLLLGAIGAALFWTKTNTGLFLMAAAFIASVCVLPAGRLRSVGSKFLLCGAVLGPMVLMHDNLRAWAGPFCLVSILAGASTVIAGMRARVHAPLRLRPVRFLALGALVASLLILLASEVERIPFKGVLEGVLAASLQQSRVFSLPLGLSKKAWLLGVVISALLARFYWTPERANRAGWVDALKCAVGMLVIAALVKRETIMAGWPSFGFVTLYVCLPLALLPRRNKPWDASEFFPRIFVTALAAMELLQAYPVAGSQVNAGAAPFLLWAFVCTYDGADGLLDRFRSSKQWHVPMDGGSAIGALVLIAVVVAMFRTGQLQSSYPFPSSSLAGSSSLHLPPEVEVSLETLSRDAQTNCEVLFTMPGMGGFNFWSGVPTPDGFNEDNWMRGVPANEQQQTLQELASNPSACVIVRPEAVWTWGVPDGGLETLPLARYILHEMPVVSRRWGYEIRVSPNRRIPWVEQSPASVDGLSPHATREEGEKQIPASG
jgi:hypothetical protein